MLSILLLLLIIFLACCKKNDVLGDNMKNPGSTGENQTKSAVEAVSESNKSEATQWFYDSNEPLPPSAATVADILKRVNNNADYREKLTVEYDKSIIPEWYPYIWLSGLSAYSCPKLEEVNTKMPVELLRKSEESVYYAIYKIKGGGVLYLFFQQSGAKDNILLWRGFYCEKALKRSDFLEVKEGFSSEMVEKIDPVAKYKYDYNFENENEIISLHMLLDGFAVIYYEKNSDGNDVVREIVFYDDWPQDDFWRHSVNILPQDYPL